MNIEKQALEVFYSNHTSTDRNEQRRAIIVQNEDTIQKKHHFSWVKWTYDMLNINQMVSNL